MDKLKIQSPNLVNENIEKIAQLFPSCVTECIEDGKPTKKVDFDLLRQELSGVLVEGKEERYSIDWAGKRQAILTANSPIAKTLRPARAESVNFGTTENLYIEGDNLDVLKLIRHTYLGKVKTIYIDPPYNTGNDFIYNDDFSVSTDEHLRESNKVDDQGLRLVANKDTSGRFHTGWLNMMYPRLKLAKDLLQDDGLIFMSMDESEIDNLLKISNEIFGRENFVGQFIWKNRTTPNDSKIFFAPVHEFIVIYAKDMQQAMFRGTGKDLSGYTNPDNDPNGAWAKDNPSAASGTEKDGRFPIVNPYTGEEYFPPKGRFWAFSQRRVAEWTASGKLVFPKEKGKNFIIKKYVSELKSNRKPIPSVIEEILTMHGTKEMAGLFPNDDRVFKYPKPTKLIKIILEQVTQGNDIIMDFFSGSAPTAQAVMQLNAEDGGSRRFIMVQLPEIAGEDSEAFKAGYKNICEIGKERIRRAGKKIAEETRITAPNLDTGFRVLKLADSNMREVFYNPNAYNQSMLLGLDTSIKEDRTEEDILFQVMLDKGISLSSKIEKRTTINGQQTYFIVGSTGFGIIDLVCCLDKKINTNAVKEIAKLNAECVVFLDSGMESDAARTNVQQVFDTYSPKTKVEVL
ncbi:MAG: site-specific DNA-methyltransferase [Firmicutes bacterium]|nr:site-specific DNA-methyltransferase [Bacillota bacterium]